MKKKTVLTVEQVWQEFGQKKFETAIKQYNIKTMSVEDIKSDIFLKLIKTKYIDKYDEKKGAVSTYLYRFVNNYMANVWRHEKTTKNGRAAASAISIAETTDDNMEQQLGKVLFLDLFQTPDLQNEYERTIFIQRLLEELEKPSFSRFHSSGPSGIPRSVKEVVKLILKGHTIPEIAGKDLMDMSYTWVRTRLLKLKNISWLREYQYGF